MLNLIPAIYGCYSYGTFRCILIHGISPLRHKIVSFNVKPQKIDILLLHLITLIEEEKKSKLFRSLFAYVHAEPTEQTNFFCVLLLPIHKYAKLKF